MAYDLSIENEIQSELQDGEQLLWQGKPNPNRLLSKYDIFMVPFSILWFGAVLFGFIKTRDNGFFPFDIMLLFFCIVGAYITIGRFLLKRSRRKKTIYLLTDKRAVEIFAASRRKVKSVYYNQMSG